jgi:hypothetical protein
MSFFWQRWAAPALALAALNIALTLGNLWPTPWITLRPELSMELAAVVLVLAVLAAWRGTPRPRAAAGLAALSALWVMGRYLDVTVPALFGRPINLYWDTQHLPRVAAMLAETAAPWRVALAAAGALAALVMLYVVLRWAWRRVLGALAVPASRRALGGAAAVILTLYVAGTGGALPTASNWFAKPVAATYTEQAAFLGDAFSAHALPATPPAASDLARVRDADVFVVFVESYGAVAFDNAGFSAALAPARDGLAQAVAASGQSVVSARVASPTYGGRSWLAHASLLAGIEVRDPRTYDLLLASRRPTLVTLFHQHGFRTVALMPGLRNPWPEGAFWDFDAVLGSRELGYAGPEFGWWRIPDQYALARLDRDELRHPDRPPLFVFFPTITSHVPFSPTPPYQPDWERVLGADPYDAAPLRAALAQKAQWDNLAPAYVDTITYAFATLAGYLRQPRFRDAVYVVLGDHQPPGSVSGPGQPWDVPVHVITRRQDILAAFAAAGFVAGMTPPRRALGPMNQLNALLAAALGSPAPAPSARAAGVDVAGAGAGRQPQQHVSDHRGVEPLQRSEPMGLPR